MQSQPLDTQDALAGYRRLVIKIGSALLVDDKSGKLRTEWLSALASDIAALKAEGRDVVIVSSGAIALGRRILGLPGKALPLDQSQAAASAGQIALSQAWASHLNAHDITTGQILLTPNITEERRYFLNARTTINTLLGLGAVPIINENDSVATFEIRYGDNDRLSARVATMIEADMLVLLSDIDGLYTAPPAHNPDARHIPHVAEITPDGRWRGKPPLARRHDHETGCRQDHRERGNRNDHCARNPTSSVARSYRRRPAHTLCSRDQHHGGTQALDHGNARSDRTDHHR